jgi:hypothetical protein
LSRKAVVILWEKVVEVVEEVNSSLGLVEVVVPKFRHGGAIHKPIPVVAYLDNRGWYASRVRLLILYINLYCVVMFWWTR